MFRDSDDKDAVRRLLLAGLFPSAQPYPLTPEFRERMDCLMAPRRIFADRFNGNVDPDEAQELRSCPPNWRVIQGGRL